MKDLKQNKLVGCVSVGICVLTFAFHNQLLALATSSTQEPDSNSEVKTLINSPAIPGSLTVYAEARGKRAWDCGAVRSNTDHLNIDNACAATAWERRKPFRLQLGTYDRNWGGYNGYLFGGRNRRLFLILNYSSVNGTWKVEKEIKDASVSLVKGKKFLLWENQQQDLGMTFPK